VEQSPDIRDQAELVTSLAKRVRRDATMLVQAAAKLESMAAENEDLREDIDDRSSRSTPEVE
jgi:hypothetical protein